MNPNHDKILFVELLLLIILIKFINDCNVVDVVDVVDDVDDDVVEDRLVRGSGTAPANP